MKKKTFWNIGVRVNYLFYNINNNHFIELLIHKNIKTWSSRSYTL